MNSIPGTSDIRQRSGRIGIVYAGGTISSMMSPQGYRKGGHVQDLVSLLQQHRPEFVTSIELGERVYAYTGLSENITNIEQQVIVNAVDEELQRHALGVLVSHGTDSLEQTAQILYERFEPALKQSTKKVIITAANEDLGHAETDAWDNLELALKSFLSINVGGVYVAFHNKLIAANEVTKMPYVDGVATFISKLDPAYKAAVLQQQEADKKQVVALRSTISREEPRVEMVTYDVNIIRPDHHKLLDYLKAHDVKAIILKLYHTGAANVVTPGSSVVELVERLRKDRGIVFFGATETGEPTDLRKYETTIKLLEAGVVPLYDMSLAVAEEKLRLLADKEPSKMIAEMLKNRVGEIDESQIIQQDVTALTQQYSQSV